MWLLEEEFQRDLHKIEKDNNVYVSSDILVHTIIAGFEDYLKTFTIPTDRLGVPLCLYGYSGIIADGCFFTKTIDNLTEEDIKNIESKVILPDYNKNTNVLLITLKGTKND